MNVLRCDRCRKEYRGEQTYLFKPYLSSHYNRQEGTRWDLCPDCREGLKQVYYQTDRVIRTFLSWEYVARTQQTIVDWYRHLVTIEPAEDPRMKDEEQEAERIREGCAKLLTDPRYANNLICTFCGGYRVDHREGQPGPGMNYPKRA